MVGVVRQAGGCRGGDAVGNGVFGDGGKAVVKCGAAWEGGWI